MDQKIFIHNLPNGFHGIRNAKPHVSLTAPTRDHFPPVSLTISGAFSSARAKAKKLFR